MAVVSALRYYVNKRHVIETCNTPTISQIERRNGGFVPSPSVGKFVQTLSFTVWNGLRAVHECEGRNIGQVNLDQFRVSILQLGGVGFCGDRLDHLIGGRIAVLTPVAVPVARHTVEFGAHQLANTAP